MKHNTIFSDNMNFLKSMDIRTILILLLAFLLLVTGLTLSILNNLGIIGRTDPTLVNTFEAPGKVTGMDIEGKYAYLTYNLFEDDDMETPLETGVQIMAAGLRTEPESIINYITPLGADCISVKDDYAFVGGRGLQVLNISDKELPVFISSHPLNIIDTSIIIEENYAYLAGYDPGSDSSKLYIIDISDSALPVVESILTIDGKARDIDLEDEFAYIAAAGNGLVIVDIIDKAAPEPVAVLSMPMVSGISVYGNTAYSIGLDFKAIDITDKHDPYISGNCSIPGTGYAICTDERYAYIINGNSYSGEGGAAIFQVIDVGDKSGPQATSSCTVDIPMLEPLETYITGNHAYITGSGNSMHILKLRY